MLPSHCREVHCYIKKDRPVKACLGLVRFDREKILPKSLIDFGPWVKTGSLDDFGYLFFPGDSHDVDSVYAFDLF